MSSGSRIFMFNEDKNGIEGETTETLDFILTNSHVNNGVQVNSTSTVTITIPNNTTLPFTKPKQFLIFREGIGRVLIAEEPGLTVLGGITEIADTSTITGGAITISWLGPNKFYINGKEL